MKDVRHFLKTVNPLTFAIESWAFLQGMRRGYWLGLIPAYCRYFREVFRDPRYWR